MTIKYGKLSGKAIQMIGEVTGRNCMKSKYARSGLNSLYPYNPDNYATLEEFQSLATLGIYEYLLNNNLISGATPADLIKARQAGYKACNVEYNAMRQADKHHLYIESYTNENGEPYIDIVDVTAKIEQMEGEVWDCISPYLAGDEVAILKMVSKGYTMETIGKRFGGISKPAVFKRIRKAQEKARQAYNK